MKLIIFRCNSTFLSMCLIVSHIYVIVQVILRNVTVYNSRTTENSAVYVFVEVFKFLPIGYRSIIKTHIFLLSINHRLMLNS